MLELYLGNKNYSSWSLRPWILLMHFAIPFREHMYSVGGLNFNPTILDVSPSGRLPALHDGALRISDSLAIAEYLAETTPEMWPRDRVARAYARSAVAEMHAGFAKLRAELPMNLKFRVQGRPSPNDVQQEIARIIAIWQQLRRDFGGDGPYLLGSFTIADAFFAPVVSRFETYNIALPRESAAYRETILAHPAMQAWYLAGKQETQAHAHYDAQTLSYGEPR